MPNRLSVRRRHAAVALLPRAASSPRVAGHGRRDHVTSRLHSAVRRIAA